MDGFLRWTTHNPTGWFVRGSWNSRTSLCLCGAEEEGQNPAFVSGGLDDCPQGLWGKDSPSSQVPTGLQMWGRNRWPQPMGRAVWPLLWFLVLQRGQPCRSSGVRSEQAEEARRGCHMAPAPWPCWAGLTLAIVSEPGQIQEKHSGLLVARVPKVI